MLIFCGANKKIEEIILKFSFSNKKLIYKDDGILIIKNKKEISFENNAQNVFFAEGSLINKPDINLLYQLDNSLRHLEGYFNLLVWDKIKKKGIFVNDKLGLNPLYYAMIDGNSLVVSTRLKDLLNLTGIEKQIDTIALSQFALFNYFLGSRTFIKGVHRLAPGTVLKWENGKITHERYWDAGNIIKEEPLPENESIEKIASLFLQVVSEWVLGHKKIGILLSGGYDSRAILACLFKLGIKGYAYTWDNPAVRETGIAQRLSKETGFKLKFLPFYPSAEATENLIYEVGEITEFNFPLFHIGRYNAIKQISDRLDIIFSGQGELIRITPVPNDYISETTLNNIYRNSDRKKIDHFFSLQEDDKSFQEFAYRHLSPVEQLTCFLLYNAYRDDYGILRYGESSLIPVVMPFFDGRIIELLLKSPYSIARLKFWKKSILFTLRNRQIYYRIISKLAPKLLEIPLDRGYPQKYDSSYWGLVMTGIGGIKNSIFLKRRKPKEIAPWCKFISNLLSQNFTINRPYYNKNKIMESLKRYPQWSPQESYELEKVVRFELWYRNFIESPD